MAAQARVRTALMASLTVLKVLIMPGVLGCWC
jgi:hypothetical protein